VRTAGTVRPRAPRAPAPTAADRRARQARFARVVGVAGLLLTTVALWWLLSGASFRVRPEAVTIEGIRLASRDAVLARLEGIARAPNVLRLRGDDLVGSLSEMPEIRSASLSVSLPADVRVIVEEREPIFAWTDDRATWLVDRDGVFVARPEVAGVETKPGTGAAGALPTVKDERLSEDPVVAGQRLDPIDLAVMTQLLSLDPARIGSAATKLELRVDQSFGYVLRSPELGWRARFGHFTPTLFRPDRIPRQVQCLATLLEELEDELVSAWLVPTDEACGTYTVRDAAR
jgi:cell division septal protein FtsQ